MGGVILKIKQLHKQLFEMQIHYFKTESAKSFLYQKIFWHLRTSNYAYP